MNNPLHPQTLRFFAVPWPLSEHGIGVEWTQGKIFVMDFDDTLTEVFFQGTKADRLAIYAVNDNCQTFRPKDNDWQWFWSSLHALGIWEWETAYERPEVMATNGELWMLEIEYDPHRLKSGGNFTVEPPLFAPFLRVLSNLVGMEVYPLPQRRY